VAIVDAKRKRDMYPNNRSFEEVRGVAVELLHSLVKNPWGIVYVVYPSFKAQQAALLEGSIDMALVTTFEPFGSQYLEYVYPVYLVDQLGAFYDPAKFAGLPTEPEQFGEYSGVFASDGGVVEIVRQLDRKTSLKLTPVDSEKTALTMLANEEAQYMLVSLYRARMLLEQPEYADWYHTESWHNMGLSFAFAKKGRCPQAADEMTKALRALEDSLYERVKEFYGSTITSCKEKSCG
jgi:hypothetical protein